MTTTLSLPRPMPAQLAWQRTETNLFFHFGMNTFSGREWGDGSEDPARFNPTALDCGQWARVAKEGGFQIAILTAKHHDGFCLWPTKTTNHSVVSSPWKGGKGDVVAEFVEAFRREGLKVGLYLSPWDRHEACYGSEAYNDLYCQQLEELLTGYGLLHEVWFDGACEVGPNGKVQRYDWPRCFAMVKEFQPQAVIFGDGGTDVRWVGNERGIAGETCWSTVEAQAVRFPGDSGIDRANDAMAAADKQKLLTEGQAPDGSGDYLWRPAECDVSIRPGWFYHPEEDDNVRSPENLLELYLKSVGRNGLLLLNLPPTPEGLVHETDIANLAAFRKKLDCLFARDLLRGGRASASSSREGFPVGHVLDADPETCWSPADDGECSIELELTEPCEIRYVVLQEAVAQGQAISSFIVEARNENSWLALARGTTIGMTRILPVEAVTVSAVRLTLTSALAPPRISRIRFH